MRKRRSLRGSKEFPFLVVDDFVPIESWMGLLKKFFYRTAAIVGFDLGRVPYVVIRHGADLQGSYGLRVLLWKQSQWQRIGRSSGGRCETVDAKIVEGKLGGSIIDTVGSSLGG